MLMRKFVQLSLMILVIMAGSCQQREKEHSDKPNILFILADDQCYQTIHALGNNEVITPTLDELARNGTVFTSVYNMGGWNGAVCIASRTMFNTGKFLWHAEAVDRKLDSLASRGALWSQVMDSLGYDTYMTGKWHVKINPEKIFRTVGTERPGMPRSVPAAYDRPDGPDDNEWLPWDTLNGGFWKGGTHWSEVVANETIGFLDSAAVSENPFFMYVAFNAPHDPRQSPAEYVDLYDVNDLAIPETFLPEYPYKDQIGCSWSLRDEHLAPMPRTEYAVKVHRQEYYAIITHMDAQLQRIMKKLEETGQMQNTYIFFTADHGLAVGNHGFMGKQNMYEHSLRPPLIVVGPDIPHGEQRDMNVYLQDIMPTAIEFAGGTVPEYVEFSSLRPLLDESKLASFYPSIYAAYKDLQRMIRLDDYKLIVYPDAGVLRLYNLENDPLEMNDLAADPGQKERIHQMMMDLVELQQEMGDTLDLEMYTFK